MYSYRLGRLRGAMPRLQIHPNARATPVPRAEIARSSEPSGTVVKRYGVSAETIRKWCKRGAGDLPGPFRLSSSPALEGDRQGEGRGLRLTAKHELPSRRHHLRCRTSTATASGAFFAVKGSVANFLYGHADPRNMAGVYPDNE
jgi:hypothetical protein